MTEEIPQPPPVAAVPPAPPPPAVPEEQSKLIELAKKQKVQRAMQLKLQSERDTLAKQQSEFESQRRQYEQNYIPKDRLRTDLIGALSEAGLNPNEIATFIQNPANTLDLQIKNQAKELHELKSQLEKLTKTAEESQSTQYEQAVQQIRFDVKNLVTNDARFETIRALDQGEAVVEVIREVFENGMGTNYPKGTVLDNESAALLVEEQLVEDALKLSSLNKVKEKLAAVSTPAAPATAPVKAAPTGVPANLDGTQKLKYRDLTKAKNPFTVTRTLTHQAVAGSRKIHNRADKIAQAIAKIEGREV